MRLRIHHRTEYQYNSPVRESENQLRMTPVCDQWQHCEASFVTILPASRLSHYTDLNGNTVHHFSLPEPHDYLVIESRSTVETKPGRIDYTAMPYGFQHADLDYCLKFEEHHPFLHDSRYVNVSPEIWREAVDIQNQSQDVFETAYAIMDFINRNFRYLPGSTHVFTHATEAISGRAGVCQDFAHAMIAYCRALRIPTRYVSGYFYDTTRDHSLKGSQASHAWVEVFIKEHGWIGLDPTNRKVIDHTYVTTAVGRDYLDVAPILGTFRGQANSAMKVSVTVDHLTE